MPKYQLGNQPFYKQGAFYPAYSVVDVPEKEASRTWTKLEDDDKPEVKAQPAKADVLAPSEVQAKRPKRAADYEPA